MAITVKEANIKKDLDILVQLLNQNRKRPVDKRRFEWLYFENPEGEAKAWIVFDEKSEKPIAFCCVLPRRVRVGGKDILCWNSGDFSVNKKFRTLGIALKLRRKAKEGVDKGEIRCFYAHPNKAMAIVHDRVGHVCLGRMYRFAKILDTRPYVEKKLKHRYLAKPIGILLNVLFEIKNKLKLRKKEGFHIEIVTQNTFGKEFDLYFEKMSSRYHILGDRGADYLTWRFSNHPHYQSETLTIRKEGTLQGYLIFYVEGDVAFLADVLCPPSGPVLFAILRFWLKRLRKRKVASVSAILLDSNPLIPFFLEEGFRKRPEESDVYVYATMNDSIKDEWLDGHKWYMTEGDRDI